MSIRAKIIKQKEDDKLILVNVKEFMKYVDQKDLSNRDSKIIENKYHKNWLYELNGCKYFVPPVAFIRDNGDIRFVNGRHRFVLLSRHLKEFPIAIDGIGNDIFGYSSDVSLKTFEEIKVKLLENDCSFLLPELEFGEFLKEKGS